MNDTDELDTHDHIMPGAHPSFRDEFPSGQDLWRPGAVIAIVVVVTLTIIASALWPMGFAG